MVSLRLSRLRVGLILGHYAVKSLHVRLDLLDVAEDVAALMGEDTRDAIEQIALEAERQGGAGVDDLLAGLPDVDLLDGLLGYLAAATALGADGGHQPMRDNGQRA